MLDITDLDHDGRGVARLDGKIVFVHGALPGERVRARMFRRKKRYDEAVCVEVEGPATERVDPPCPWFTQCGGCALQHLDYDAQLAWKQRRVEDDLERIGSVHPQRRLEPVVARPWQYRRRARLSARDVRGKGRVLVGFREINGRYVADIEYCMVLHPAFSQRLMELSALLGRLSVRAATPQVEIAAGDEAAAIILRHLEPLAVEDERLLKTYAESSGLAVYLQSGGSESIHRLAPDEHELAYRLPEFGIELGFEPVHFVQINSAVNRALVSAAVELLDPGPDERLLDLYCGLGNFNLALATRAGEVIGIDGDPALIDAAAANARRNDIDNVRWIQADLAAAADSLAQRDRRGFSGVLLDPPRSGAVEALPLIADCGARRAVYVSCNPATLARDAAVLVKDMGFAFLAAGIVDMFPHTAHVESISLFERPV